MKIINNEAMILAAGFGKRMLPLTKDLPKPLARINNKPILKHCLEKLYYSGIEKVVINTHHIHNKISDFTQSLDMQVELIYEKKLLDTGGGVLNAIRKGKIGKKDLPFFIFNGDSYWIEQEPIIANLSEGWDNSKMDILLVLEKKDKLFGYDGLGDFDFESDSEKFGLINNDALIKKFVFTGVQLLNPNIFKRVNLECFSLRDIYLDAMMNKRLFGLVDNNEWFHVGTMKTLKEINFRKK
tara:strand:- start:1671 stop:2390 length:720 start_codon:yes stop_codon:yes gene_type:complete